MLYISIIYISVQFGFIYIVFYDRIKQYLNLDIMFRSIISKTDKPLFSKAHWVITELGRNTRTTSDGFAGSFGQCFDNLYFDIS